MAYTVLPFGASVSVSDVYKGVWAVEFAPHPPKVYPSRSGADTVLLELRLRIVPSFMVREIT